MASVAHGRPSRGCARATPAWTSTSFDGPPGPPAHVDLVGPPGQPPPWPRSRRTDRISATVPRHDRSRSDRHRIPALRPAGPGAPEPRGSAPTAGGRGRRGRRRRRPGPGRHRPPRRCGRPGATGRPAPAPSRTCPRPRLGPPHQVVDDRVPPPVRRRRRRPRAGTEARTAAASSSPSMHQAGRARFPTMTGWTNSTARCRACAGHRGARHQSVAPRDAVGPRSNAATARPPATARSAVTGTGGHGGHVRAHGSRPPRPGPEQAAVVGRHDLRWVSTSKPAGPAGSRASPTRSAFWNTPPLSATWSMPVASASRPATLPTITEPPPGGTREPCPDRTPGSHVPGDGPEHRGRDRRPVSHPERLSRARAAVGGGHCFQLHGRLGLEGDGMAHAHQCS